MNMQTGPAPKQSMDNWLLITGIVEIANIAVFGFLCWTLSNLFGTTEKTFTIIGFLTLAVMLLEGGMYWLLVRGRFFRKSPAKLRLRLLQGVYGINILLMLVFPVLLLIRAASGYPIQLADVLLGGGFYLFGVGEFLHYFVFKINMRPYEWRNAMQTGKFVPARVRRELHRARRELQG